VQAPVSGCEKQTDADSSDRRNRGQNADHDGQHEKAAEEKRHLSHEGLLNTECPAHRVLRNEARDLWPNCGGILGAWLRPLQMQIQPEKADQMDSARACVDIQSGTEGFHCAALI
jgi:hypothetical protein